MKYIDAEKLIAEIDNILSACTKQTHTGVYNTCHRIKGIINSLQQDQPEVDLEKASRNVYQSWMGGTMNDVRRDMVELGKVLNARKENK